MISSPEPNKATHKIVSPPQKTQILEPLPQLSEDVDKLLIDGAPMGTPSLPHRRWRGLNLRVKATLVAIALGTLPVLGTGAIAYYLADKSIVNQIQQEKRDRSVGIADTVNRFMAERYGDIQIMASLPILTNPKVQAATTIQEKQTTLNHFIDAYGLYDSIVVTDLAGNTILQSLGPPTKNISDREYFKEVIKTNTPVITPPVKSGLTGKYVIFTAAPIVDTVTGKTVGVVRSRMPVKFLEKVIDKLGTKGEQYRLIDSSGKYFLVSEATRDVADKDATAAFAGLDQLQASHKVVSQVMIDSKNIEQLVAYAPLEKLAGFPDLNWGILLTTDTAIAFAPQKQLLLALAIGTGLAALLVGAIASYLVNRATKPILAATDAVEKLGQGELYTRVAVAGDDEIATLGFNINRMADQIQTLVESQTAEAQRVRLFAEIATSRAVEDIDSVLSQAVKGVREILNADRVVVYRFNPNWSGYIAAESVLPGWPVALADKISDACIETHLLEGYRNGRVVPTNDVLEAGFHPDHLQLLARLQIKANLVTPIVNNDQLFGLLIAHHCSGPYFWQQYEIDFLTQASAQLGLILDRVSLLEQRQAEAKRAELLKDITVRMAQSLKLQDVTDVAVQLIRQGLNTDRVVIYGLDPVTWKGTVIAESVVAGWPQSLGIEIDDACLRQGQVERYKQGQVTQINDVSVEPRVDACYLRTLSRFAVKANLVAPIMRDNELFGLLIAHQCEQPRVWQRDEVDLFTQLATQIGVTLDRASLLEKLEQARATAEMATLEQRQQKESLQKRALELLMEVDPIGRGDLTIRANVTEDEIGTVADSYNATVESLRKIVTQVQTAAKQVATTTSSNEISVAELSAEALRQAEEIAAALVQIQQMSDSIRAVASNAKQAETVVQQANQTVQAGDAAMNRTVNGILAIKETVTEASQKVKQLGVSSQKISKVVKLISSFADQTNLLALNAAIEAARAGEQGRGFAVVADEVGSLARQSVEATVEIETLVAEIQAETLEVVTAMETGTQQVTAGTKLVDDTRLSLNKITAASTQISTLVAAIASAAVAQSQTSMAVTQTISDVAAIANKNSTEATVVSDSFKELIAVAQQLQSSVGQFKVS